MRGVSPTPSLPSAADKQDPASSEPSGQQLSLRPRATVAWLLGSLAKTAMASLWWLNPGLLWPWFILLLERTLIDPG